MKVVIELPKKEEVKEALQKLLEATFQHKKLPSNKLLEKQLNKSMKYYGITMEQIAEVVQLNLREDHGLEVDLERCLNAVRKTFYKTESKIPFLTGYLLDKTSNRSRGAIGMVIKADDSSFSGDENLQFIGAMLNGPRSLMSAAKNDIVKRGVIRYLDTKIPAELQNVLEKLEKIPSRKAAKILQKMTKWFHRKFVYRSACFGDDGICHIAGSATARIFYEELGTPEEYKEYLANLLESLEITNDMVAEFIYFCQVKYTPNLTTEECLRAVEKISQKRIIIEAIMEADALYKGYVEMEKEYKRLVDKMDIPPFMSTLLQASFAYGGISYTNFINLFEVERYPYLLELDPNNLCVEDKLRLAIFNLIASAGMGKVAHEKYAARDIATFSERFSTFFSSLSIKVKIQG